MNRHLAESVQRDCARNRISGHVENRIERLTGFVPLAGVMSINFAEVTQRRWIGGIHLVRSLVKTLSSNVVFGDLRTQALTHDGFNLRALHAIKNGRVGNTADFFNAEFLQLFRSVFRFLRKQAFFVGDRFQQRDGARVVSRCVISESTSFSTCSTLSLPAVFSTLLIGDPLEFASTATGTVESPMIGCNSGVFASATVIATHWLE